MTPGTVLRKLLDYCCDRVDGAGGQLTQEPYKGDLFKIFLEAYRGGMFSADTRRAVSGDALRRYANEQKWTRGDEDADDPRRQVLNQACEWIDAWTYALDNYPQSIE